MRLQQFERASLAAHTHCPVDETGYPATTLCINPTWYAIGNKNTNKNDCGNISYKKKIKLLS